jgi:hypothetical protein
MRISKRKLGMEENDYIGWQRIKISTVNVR